MTPTHASGAADLPEALRVPLDSLHADAGYLCGRLLNGSLTQEQVVESIRRRIDAAKLAALTAQAISAEPAEHVQNPAENEHVAGDVSGNGAGLNMSTPHARITELESQLAQRFDAADMATAAAQGFRDGVAPVSAVSERITALASAQAQPTPDTLRLRRHLCAMFEHLPYMDDGEAQGQSLDWLRCTVDQIDARIREVRLERLASAQAQPAAQQGAAYAATPTSNYAGRVYEEGFLIGTCPLYTADQLRAFADATYALRASNGQAQAAPKGDIDE